MIVEIRKKVIILIIGIGIGAFCGGCSILDPTWLPYNLKSDGKEYSINKLPLGRSEQRETFKGSRMVNDDKVENIYGSQNKCFYIFEVDATTHRMVGWRFMYKNDPRDCFDTDSNINSDKQQNGKPPESP